MKYLPNKINGSFTAGCMKTLTNLVRLQSTCNDTGGAGSIRDAGGAFKKRGMAKESQYFYKKERELLQKIKESMNDQKRFHEEQIAVHKCALEKIKNKEKTID